MKTHFSNKNKLAVRRNAQVGNIWISFLRLASRLGILSLSLCLSCGCQDCKIRIYSVQATFYYINETSVTITNNFSEKTKDIFPNDTLVIVEKRRFERMEKPTINNYSPKINTRTFYYLEKEKLKCELSARRIKNYENRKELMPKGDTLVFQFTYRFTEADYQKAVVCD